MFCFLKDWEAIFSDVDEFIDKEMGWLTTKVGSFEWPLRKSDGESGEFSNKLDDLTLREMVALINAEKNSS